jgi:hypothetical protein
MHNRITSKQIIRDAKLIDRSETDEGCAANFSRWLRHTEEAGMTWLLNDNELEKIREWITNNIGQVSRPDLLRCLLPNYLSLAFQHWLAPEGSKPRLGDEYVVYRVSAIASGQIVIGRLHFSCDQGSTIEEYELTGAGPKSGRYHAEGMFLQSPERDMYLLSKFDNGDLQTAIFPNADIQNSGYGDNKIITMSGVVMGTMVKKPYVARIHCEAASGPNLDMRTTPLEELPPHIQSALTRSVDVSVRGIANF